MKKADVNRIVTTLVIIAVTLGLTMAGGFVRWQGITGLFKGSGPEKPTGEDTVPTARTSNKATCAHTTAFSGMPFALKVEGCSVTGESGSIGSTSEIEISALDSMPPLAAGMVNVTRGHAGYRLSPASLQFARPVSVELGYDSLLLPKGHSTKEIRTFLYNDEKRHWEALPRDSVVEGSQNIVSQSRQTGEMINAIVQLPELPESKAFTPTMLAELEGAHPALGITLMAPPQANSQGTANLNYPITVPSGRGGLQPNLSISYNSEAGNGLLGMGWDMQLPAITVDSKWGVPRYDGDYETECYSYNGQDLLPSPRLQNGFILCRSEMRFYPRVESGFDSIIRHGTTPKNYWWEVTDKGGTIYYYGSYDGSGCDTSVLMSDSVGNIGHWPLCLVEDINGNRMRYNYSKRHQYSEYQQGYPATSPQQGVPSVYLGQQLWTESIQYAGHGSDTGRYRVVFCSDAVSRESAFLRSCASSVSVSRNTWLSSTVSDDSRKTATRGEAENMIWGSTEAEAGSNPDAPSDALCEEENITVCICLESPCSENANLSGARIGIGRTPPVFADNGNPGTPYPVTFDFAGNGYNTSNNDVDACFCFHVCADVTYHAVVQPPAICGDDPISFTFRVDVNGVPSVTDGNGISMIGAHVYVDAGCVIRVPVECDCNLPSICYDCAPEDQCDNFPPISRKKIYIGVQDNFCEMDRLPHCLFSLTRVNDPAHTECRYTTGYPKIQPVEVRENELYHVQGYWFGGRYQQSPVEFTFSVSRNGCVTVSNEFGVLSTMDPHILVKDYSCNGTYGYIELLMPVVPECSQVRICMTDEEGRGVSGCRLLAGRMTENLPVGLYTTDINGYTPVFRTELDVAYCIGETEHTTYVGNPDYRGLLADWSDAVRLYLKCGMCELKKGSLSTPADSVRYWDGVYTFYYPVTSPKETIVRVRKSDASDGLPLEYSLFGYSRRSDGNGVLGTVQTDVNGISSGIPLRCGVSYRVRELFPPAGYRRSLPAYAVVRNDGDGVLHVLESRHLRSCVRSGDVWTLDFGNEKEPEPSHPFPVVTNISCDSYAYDNTVSVRNGYRQSSKEKLLRVMVYYRDSCVRSYDFCYGQDLFGRARLASAKEYGADSLLGYREHRFDYYGDYSDRQFYGPSRATIVGAGSVDAALQPLLIDPLQYLSVSGITQSSLLGGSRTIAMDISAGASLGLFPAFFLRTLSAGLNVNGSFSTGRGRTSLTDIDGDGLPDLLYDSIRPFVRLQQQDGSFECRPRAVEGNQSFLRDYTDNVGVGLQVSSVVNEKVQKGRSSSWTSNYIADMDGDGLVDLVTPRNVLHPFLSQRHPKFTYADCQPPQASLVADTVRVHCDDRFSFKDEPYERDRSGEIRYDLVRVWEAELDNSQLQDLTYSVCAPVRLSYDSIAMENFCGEADSVIVSIEYYGTGLTGSPAHLLLWSDVIGDSDTLPHGPDHCSASDASCLLRIRKVDAEGMPLEGAEFETDGNGVITTDADGYGTLIEFSPEGCITLQETYSPCNGTLSSTVICNEGDCGIIVIPDIYTVTTEMIGGQRVNTVTITNDCASGRRVSHSRSTRACTNPSYDLSALPLAKGDRLYFRLRPQDNGVRKKILWDPAIIPHSATLVTSGGLDENGRLFGGGDKASESQILQGDSIFCCPAKGKIAIESVIPQLSSPLSDSVSFEIWRGQTVLDRYTIESGLTPSEYRFVRYLSVDSIDKLKFVVRCRSNVDMGLVRWFPKVYYIFISSGNTNVSTVTTNSAGDSVRLMEYVVAPWHEYYPHVSVPGGVVCHAICSNPATMVPVRRSITSIQVTSAGSGSGWLTVKQDGIRAYAQRVGFNAGTTTIPVNVSAMLEDNSGKPVYVSLYVDNLAAGVTGCKVTIDGIGYPAVIYARRANDILTGSHYGGWGQFQYRTGPLPDNNPLSLMDLGKLRTLHRITVQNAGQYADTSALGRSLCDVEEFSLSNFFDKRLSAICDTLHCLPMNNDAVYRGHSGLYANAFIRGAAMNLGGIPCPGFLREAEEAVAFCPQPDDLQSDDPQSGGNVSTPASGMPLSNVLSGMSSMKKSRSITASASFGVSLIGIGYGENSSKTTTFQERDLTDLNGDGFPDIISQEDGVWYSFPAVALWESSPRNPFHGDAHHHTVSIGRGKNFSADPATFHAIAMNSGRGEHVVTESENPSRVYPGISKSSNGVDDYTLWTLLDINGVGLPDRLYTHDSVALNYGYGFQPKECWRICNIGISHSNAFSSSVGIPLGGDKFSGGDKSYSGGVSGSESYNRSEEMLADINGDGKPDRVVIIPGLNKMRIYYNTGCGFNSYYDSIIVSGRDSALYRWTTTRSLGANFGLTLGFPVAWWAKVSASGGTDISISLSSSVIQFMDMDGDGYADLVLSPDENTLIVRYSTLGRTGLLKTVTNPLGGSITLGYRMMEANVFHSRRWVMDTVLVCDSLPGDGAEVRMTTWDYGYGYYNRTEREFFGFAKVKERHHGDLSAGTIKRTYTRYFKNDSIQTKGHMLCEEVRNGGDSLYVVTANRYGSRTLNRGGNVSAFVTLDTATVCYYEGGTTARIRRHSTFAYETAYGNLVRQTENSTDQPLVITDVSYHANHGNYRVGVPKSVEIAGYRKRTTEIDNIGRITAFRDWYSSAQNLATRLQYDQYGNVITMRSPNTTVHYTYDDFVHTYPTAITDTFGISYYLQDYDFRFGIPRTITDQAGSSMEYTLDEWGRTKTIRAPKEIAGGAGYTICYTYAGREPASTGSTHRRAVSMAMTEHYDPQHPANSIKTYTYCDGRGRIVQTRKEAEIGGVEKLIISGHTVVDAIGRTVAGYYPTEIHKDSTRFRFITDRSAPASTATYDVLDRPLEQTAPDASTTTFQYGFDNSHLHKVLFSTTTTDANNHSSVELKDVFGKPWVIQPSGQQPVYFDYNLAGDNTRVYSSVANDWGRNYTYDMLGRRLGYMEGGLDEKYTFNGGNLSSHTQNWLENGNSLTKTIQYHYNAHRLDSVSYDDALTTIYHYDRHGRVDSLYDESGVICYT